MPIGVYPRKYRPIEERFWEKVRISETGCWIWQGGRRNSTELYGTFGIKNGSVAAHRMAFALTYGDIPIGLDVCHHCDTPACVRPDHLFLATRVENNRDRDMKGRVARGEKRHVTGGKLIASQVLEIRRRRAEGETLRTIALAFGVSSQTIHGIVQGRYWSHI